MSPLTLATLIILAVAVIGTALIILVEVFRDARRRIDAPPIPTGTRGADRYDYPDQRDTL